MILSAVWGGAFTLNKLALNFYSPEFIVFARLIIGTFILFLLLMIMYRRITISLRDWQYYLFMSTVGIVAPFILIVYGQQQIDSSLAGILMATMPISTIILSHFFLHDEKLTRRKFTGFVIAFIGITILVIKITTIVDINVEKAKANCLSASLSNNVISSISFSDDIYDIINDVAVPLIYCPSAPHESVA